MNTNLSSTIATERHQRLVDEASAYRRGNPRGQHNAHRRHRVAAFLKDLAAASL
jgi:hypothetical protein